MTKLTVELIRQAIAGNPKISQEIDLDEPGKAIVCTTYGWMFEDGTSTLGFLLKGNEYEIPDTKAYLKEQLSWIIPNPEEK